METIKNKIKTLAGQQRDLKLQRKTVHFTGTRTIDPWQAVAKHLHNRSELRKFNLIYGLAKGRSVEQVDKAAPKIFNMEKIQAEAALLQLEFQTAKLKADEPAIGGSAE